MFDLLAIALFQLATFFGPVGQAAPTSEADTTTVGSGGWGHDMQAPPTTEPASTVGSGGWGHD